MTIVTPIEQNAAKQVANSLSVVLADTYILYIKTQNFHWNVVDPRFYSLHKMLEKQYEELADAVDEIAERIRMLGQKSPGSMKEFLKLTSLQEADNDEAANEMIRQLANDHQAIAKHISPLIPTMQKLGDEGSADLLIQRLRYHEKTAWMLTSHFLEK